VRGAVRVGGLASAHDIAEGGLAVALAECCLAGGLGAQVELDLSLAGEANTDLFATLLGEASGGFLVSGTPTGVRSLGRRTPVRVIGTAGGEHLRIVVGGERLEISLGELAQAHAALALLFS
jgi:phosphoribosylformylglycinamidine (FGAM) synthase-like enzyme